MFDRLIVRISPLGERLQGHEFRFDLMGHIMLKTMLKAKAKLESLTLEKDGIDGSKLYMAKDDYARLCKTVSA